MMQSSWRPSAPSMEPEAAKEVKEASPAVKQNLRSCAEFLRRHIYKENNVLCPLANRILGKQDQEQFLEAFEGTERKEIEEGTQEVSKD